MTYFDVLNVLSPWVHVTVANIYKNIFKVIPLVNELIRRPASIRYTVVLRQGVPEGVNITTFVVSKHSRPIRNWHGRDTSKRLYSQAMRVLRGTVALYTSPGYIRFDPKKIATECLSR